MVTGTTAARQKVRDIVPVHAAVSLLFGQPEKTVTSFYLPEARDTPDVIRAHMPRREKRSNEEAAEKTCRGRKRKKKKKKKMMMKE